MQAPAVKSGLEGVTQCNCQIKHRIFPGVVSAVGTEITFTFKLIGYRWTCIGKMRFNLGTIDNFQESRLTIDMKSSAAPGFGTLNRHSYILTRASMAYFALTQ